MNVSINSIEIHCSLYDIRGENFQAELQNMVILCHMIAKYLKNQQPVSQ